MKSFRSGRNNSLGLVLGLLLSLAALFMVIERDWVRDSITLMQFTPSSEIVAISERTRLTERGERYFLASQPELNATSSFSEICKSEEKTTAVLGCYSGSRIYLFGVDNEELDGIVEVTAAHEMLHAAYDRLSARERARIDELLVDERSRLSSEASFVERMSVYANLSSAEQVNELHSVIGTEIATIDPELESYYSKYFEERQHIVGLYGGYSSVFTDIQQQASQLADSLDRQAIDINRRVELHNQANSALNQAILSFNARASSGAFTTQAEFDVERGKLAARVAALEAERQAIDRAILAYDRDKATYDGLAGHLRELSNSIDSSLAPTQTIEGSR